MEKISFQISYLVGLRYPGRSRCPPFLHSARSRAPNPGFCFRVETEGEYLDATRWAPGIPLNPFPTYRLLFFETNLFGFIQLLHRARPEFRIFTVGRLVGIYLNSRTFLQRIFFQTIIKLIQCFFFFNFNFSFIFTGLRILSPAD